VPVVGLRDMVSTDPDTNELIRRARSGNERAREDLFDRHRERLKAMVNLRMDRRLLRRLDASDVVQETFAEAWDELEEYLERQPLPFYAWLRQIAWERLMNLHRFHLETKKRSIRREEVPPPLPDRSSVLLANRLTASVTSPGDRLVRKERGAKAVDALRLLPEPDQEMLALIYLERLSTAEVAAIMSSTEAAIKMRHLRVLRKMRDIVGDA